MDKKKQIMIGSGVLVGLIGIYFGWNYYSKNKTPENKTPENVKLEVAETKDKKEQTKYYLN